MFIHLHAMLLLLSVNGSALSMISIHLTQNCEGKRWYQEFTDFLKSSHPNFENNK